jgi:hypothetical protein
MGSSSLESSDCGQGADGSSSVKLPRGLRVRLERVSEWRLSGEQRKMLPAELR